NLRTYIDMDLQQLAEKMMANKVGGVVAIDPKTGGILAMASGPNYNPNDLTGPLLNRAIQGNYEPGSTFKPLGALVGLNEGVITPSYGYDCRGRYNAC